MLDYLSDNLFFPLIDKKIEANSPRVLESWVWRYGMEYYADNRLTDMPKN